MARRHILFFALRLSCMLLFSACGESPSLSVGDIRMTVGDSAPIEAVLSGTEEAISYTADSSALLIENGTVTALIPGIHSVQAKCGDLTVSFTVTAEDPGELQIGEHVLPIGFRMNLRYTFTAEAGISPSPSSRRRILPLTSIPTPTSSPSVRE